MCSAVMGTIYALLQVVLATLGTLSFASVEWRHYKKPSPNKFK